VGTIAKKMAKQFEYQRTLFRTSAYIMDLFVAVDDLTAYLSMQARGDRRIIRRHVKAELERMASAGEARRWVEVYGRSQRADRDDHYFLTAKSRAQ
jgi:hypothetical protein